jgi:hypothetical protein
VPIFKPRLTRREQAKYLTAAEELLAGGLALEIPDEWRDNTHALHIEIGGPPASSIYQLASGIVVYVVRVKLVAERGGMILEDFEITPAWDSSVYPCGSERGSYRLAAGLQYDWNEVLNHRIENHLRFRRGDLADGWLLATGSKSIPPEYGPGRPAPLEVAFLDQFSKQHKVSGDFVVERSAKTPKSAVRPGPGLFDPVSSTARSAIRLSSQSPARPSPCENFENMQRGRK